MKYRIADFENANIKSDLRFAFSLVEYYPHSLYVKRIRGIVYWNEMKLRVSWDSIGRATLHSTPVPEFDLILKH